MKVFISWSGGQSRDVALAIREWLRQVIQQVDPWVSDEDIAAGGRWSAEIATRLDESNFGIVCVTPENQAAPWLNFEAGAIGKSLDSGQVVPLAFGLSPAEVEPPLGQFQAKRADKKGIASIVRSINQSMEQPLEASVLDEAIETYWPRLEEKLTQIQADHETSGEVERREDREILEEILDTVRAMRWPEPSRSTERFAAESFVRALRKQLETSFEGSDLYYDPERKAVLARFKRPLAYGQSDQLKEIAATSGVDLDILITPKPDLGASDVQKALATLRGMGVKTDEGSGGIFDEQELTDASEGHKPLDEERKADN